MWMLLGQIKRLLFTIYGICLAWLYKSVYKNVRLSLIVIKHLEFQMKYEKAKNGFIWSKFGSWGNVCCVDSWKLKSMKISEKKKQQQFMNASHRMTR